MNLHFQTACRLWTSQYLWISFLTRADSQIHFFQQGIVRANQTSPFFSANHMNASPPPEAVLPTKSLNLATFQNNMSCQKGLATNLATFGLWGDVDTDTKTFYVKVRPQFMILNEQQVLPSLKAWNSGVASLCSSAVVSEPQQTCNTPGLQNESHVHKPAP